jgi:hypothetical protein
LLCPSASKVYTYVELRSCASTLYSIHKAQHITVHKQQQHKAAHHRSTQHNTHQHTATNHQHTAQHSSTAAQQHNTQQHNTAQHTEDSTSVCVAANRCSVAEGGGTSCPLSPSSRSTQHVMLRRVRCCCRCTASDAAGDNMDAQASEEPSPLDTDDDAAVADADADDAAACSAAAAAASAAAALLPNSNGSMASLRADWATSNAQRSTCVHACMCAHT